MGELLSASMMVVAMSVTVAREGGLAGGGSEGGRRRCGCGDLCDSV